MNTKLNTLILAAFVGCYCMHMQIPFVVAVGSWGRLGGCASRAFTRGICSMATVAASTVPSSGMSSTVYDKA